MNAHRTDTTAVYTSDLETTGEHLDGLKAGRAAPRTYFVQDDADGEPTLWRATEDEPVAVAYRSDLDRFGPDAWPVLVGVLTQDAETVDRVARAIAAAAGADWADLDAEDRASAEQVARAALSGVLPAAGTEVTS